MYIVIFCSILAFILTCLEAKAKLRGGMKLGFGVLAILGAIHYNYGNDYMAYYDLFYSVTTKPFNLAKIIAGDYFHDSGWVILCYVFKHLGGFFAMVAVLNIVQNIIVYKFIKKNIQRSWWPLAIFVYLFVTSFYLMSFSMMRQMFVTVVFLGMWDNIAKCKWVITIIVLYICSFLHGSAIALLPFAFWGYLPVKKAKYIGFVYLTLIAVLFLFQDVLNHIFTYVTALDDGFGEYVDKYSSDTNNFSLGLGFIINMVPFILSVIYLSRRKTGDSSKVNLLVALGAISFLIIPFGQTIHLVNRLGIYFAIYSIATYPIIYANIKNKLFRIILLGFFVLITLYNYYKFFTNSVFSTSYSNFHTIFS